MNGPPRPVRVLQMCAVDFTAKHFLLPLAEALRREHYDVTFSCAAAEYADDIRSRGFELIHNPIARSTNPFRHLVEIWRSWRIMRDGEFNIVHVHTPIAALVGRIAARLAGVPVRVYTAHGFYFHENMPPVKKAFHVLLERIGARFGTHLFTVSAEDEATALQQRIAKPGRVTTIYNGIDLDHFDPDTVAEPERQKLRAGHSIGPSDPVAGIVGRMVREKGFMEFFEAAAIVLHEHPAAKFLVVGDALRSDYDASTAAMHARIERLGIRHALVFAGMVPDTRPWLSIMDVFCLPSYREGMPVSVLEAMAMKVPVVATNIRGCREEVVEGETGYLVPVRNAQLLAERVNELFSNRERARAMGEAGRRRVAKHFELNQVLEKQLVVYEQLVQEKLGR